MSLDPHDLAARIAALCADMRDIEHEQVELACNLASDIIAETSPDTLADESLIDGLRWGHRAATSVERTGGAIIRIRTPGGSALTHEYFKAPTDRQLAMMARAIEANMSTRGVRA